MCGSIGSPHTAQPCADSSSRPWRDPAESRRQAPLSDPPEVSPSTAPPAATGAPGAPQEVGTLSPGGEMAGERIGERDPEIAQKVQWGYRRSSGVPNLSTQVPL